MRFVLIDGIDRLKIGRHAEGHKNIAADEDYFHDHFPGYPVMPGVLVLESLVQLGGRLIGASVRADSGRRVLPMLVKVEEARFLRQVRPGSRLDLAVDVVGIRDEAARAIGVASVDGHRVATVAIMYALVDISRASGSVSPAEADALHEWTERIWHDLLPDRDAGSRNDT